MEFVKVDDNDRKIVTGISKFIAIISKIGRIFIYIGICFIILFMTIIPTLVKHTTVKDNLIAIKYDDSKMEIKKEGKKTVYYLDDVKKGSEKDTEVFDFIAKKYSSYSEKQLIGYSESYFIIILAYLVITSVILKYVEKLFKNFSSEKTPFTTDNLVLISNVLKYKIVAMIIPIIGVIVFDVILKLGNPFDFATVGVVEILVLFVVLHLFKYACFLQEGTEEQFYE